MAYTEIVSNRAGLRDQTYTKDALAERTATEIENTNQFGRGWASAGLQGDAGSLLDKANDAYRSGDLTLGRALEQQGRDTAQQAQQWAPTVKSARDVNSLASAGDWFAGSMGNLRSSVEPALGAVAGAGLGAAVGLGLRNPALGAKVGGAIGGFIPGYNMEANETIATGMLDPSIRASKSLEEIKNTGRVKGVVGGALEAAVPAMMVGKAAGLAGRIGKGDALSTIGKSIGEGAVTEFGTEGAQSIAGQVAENSLRDERLGSIDYGQAFDEGLSGAVAGGGMGALGGAGQVASSSLGRGRDKVDKVRRDPIGAVADGVTDAGAAIFGGLGKVAGKLQSNFEQSFTAEAAHMGRLMEDTGTSNDAIKHAQLIIERPDASEDSRQDAADLLAGNMDWQTYRDKRFIKTEEGRRGKQDEDIAAEINTRMGESKQSRMSSEEDTSRGTVEGLADIWRKQGVDPALIEASETLNKADRASAIATLGWVSRGFTDMDGNVFVPESFTNKYKGGSARRVEEAVDLAVKQGLLSEEVAASTLPTVLDMVQKQWLNQTNVFDTVMGAIKTRPLDRKWTKADVEEFIPELRRMAQIGTTEAEEGFLLQLFGDKAGVAQAMSAFKEKKAVTVEDGAGIDNVDSEETDLGSDTLDYATREKAKAPTLVGRNGDVSEDATPFDTNSPADKGSAEGILGSTQLDSHPGSVGLVDHYTEGLDGEDKRDAQNDLLDAHGGEYLDKKQAALVNATGVGVADLINQMHHNSRTAILGKINKRFRYVTANMEAAYAQSADKVYNKASFAEDFDERGEAATIAKGGLFLETQGKTPFKTSALRVLKHVWRANNKEQTTTTPGQGAHQLHQQLMQGLAALIDSDPSYFTGRIGYKTTVGGEGKWLKKGDGLPKDFRMSGSTMADAKVEMESARRKGDDEYDNVAYAETPNEKRRALIKFGVKMLEKGHDKFAHYVRGVLDTKNKEKIERLYTKLRNDTTSGMKLTALVNHQSYSDLPSGKNVDREQVSKVLTKKARNKDRRATNPSHQKTQKKDVSDRDVLDKEHSVIDANDKRDRQNASYSSIRDADPTSELRRDSRGVLVGFGDDAAFGAVEGGAKHDRAADDSVSQADRTKDPLRATKLLEEAKQWVVDLIDKKGVPSVNAAVKKLSEERVLLLKRAMAQISRETDVDAFEKHHGLTKDSGASILNIIKKMVAADVRNDATRDAGKSGQSDALGQPKGEGSVQSVDKGGVLPAADMGAGKAEKGSGQGVSNKRASKEEVAAARKEVLDTVGIKAVFKKTLGGISGVWEERSSVNAIAIALNSDVLSTAYHESLHEFFNILKKHGDTNVRTLLEKVSSNKLVMRRMETLLAKHPAALDQIKSDPEEAVAFMYQFWRTGALKLGPNTEGLFNKVKNFFKAVHDKLRGVVSDEAHAERIMAAFAKGAVKNTTGRDAVVKALNEITEKHNSSAESVGTFAQKFTGVLKYAYTAEGMMELTSNPSMLKLAEMLNQKAGASMVKGADWEGSYIDAKSRINAVFQNRMENILSGEAVVFGEKLDLSKEDIQLVREALATGTTPKIDRIERVVAEMKKLNEDLMDYVDNRNISRLEDGKWVKVQKRKDFGMPQIWSVDTIASSVDDFKADLIKHHLDKLTAIAAQANEEIAAFKKGNDGAIKKGTAAHAALERDIDRFDASGKSIGKMNIEEVTPEMVVDAITTRVLMSNGKVDIEETSSELGISPLAASVNRRSLSWIDPSAFDKYKETDLLNIYSSYIAGMTKRGEYGVRFGHGGEVIRDNVDMAFLYEMGGDKLISRARLMHPIAIKAWTKRRENAKKAGELFDEPYPTLRSEGNKLHKNDVGAEKFNTDILDAAKKLEQAVKAIQAIEGTLGMDVSPAVRDINSWLMTYQNIRLLPFSLFTSMSDVVGLTLNGGTLGDAWDAFVRGMREVKRGVINDDKTTDEAAMRAEMWGSVDAVTLNETMGQGYGSMFMSGKMKHISNKFFKKIGMESWNRSMRISATAVAERMIIGWTKNEGLDKTDSGAFASQKARLERLYGKGASAKDIKLDADGRLDVTDPRNQAAIMRFVNDAVLRPNAAMRPIWGSDPHYASFFHLKSFSYAMHKMWLEGALNEAKLGNYKPAMVLLSVYIPVGIAAGAAKEMLIPGEEPPWMQGGLDGYLSYGASKAGLLGVPQLIGGSWDTGFTDLAGPTVSQMRKALVNYDNPLKTAAGALPGGGTLQRYVPND